MRALQHLSHTSATVPPLGLAPPPPPPPLRPTTVGRLNTHACTCLRMHACVGAGIPDDVRAKAKEYMQGTRHYFRPLQPGEWPPAHPYKGWTKKSCPFAAGAARAQHEEQQAQQPHEQGQEKLAGQEQAPAAAAHEVQQGAVPEAEAS